MVHLPFSRQLAALAACGLCLCLALAAPAGAATAGDYPPDPVARDFSTGAGGWTSTTSFDGSCTTPVLCPSIVNSQVPAGGADGNGYITAAFTGVVGAQAVAGTSTSVWESPRFVYAGAGGDQPGSLAFTMSRRASVDQLLAVQGNSAEYSVQLRDLSAGGEGPTVIAPTTLAGADTWSPVPAVAVQPSRLKIGDAYKILITSRYTTGTSVLVTGSADYDDVDLRALPGGGTGGGTGPGGRNGLRSAELLALYRAGVSGTAVLKGNRLLVRVSCPKPIGANCRIAVQGLLNRHGPATAWRVVKVASGHRKLVVLRVKPKLRAKIAKRRRLLVREQAKAGGATATVYRVRKLIRRR